MLRAFTNSPNVTKVSLGCSTPRQVLTTAMSKDLDVGGENYRSRTSTPRREERDSGERTMGWG